MFGGFKGEKSRKILNGVGHTMNMPPPHHVILSSGEKPQALLLDILAVLTFQSELHLLVVTVPHLFHELI